MPENFQIAQLRLSINEPDNTAPYTTETLTALVAQHGSVPGAAAAVWTQKAAQLAMLVNTSEGGSTRANGDLYKNALAMAARFQAEADALNRPSVVDTSRTRTRRIERV